MDGKQGSTRTFGTFALVPLYYPTSEVLRFILPVKLRVIHLFDCIWGGK